MIRPTSQILDRHGKLLYEIVDLNTGKQLSLSIDQIPRACIEATLATEDSRFYRHPGFDPIAIVRALWQNWRAGGSLLNVHIVSGGSTLTQQVARNLLMPPEERFNQSYRRKMREIWLALQLELNYTKDEILALYLNQTYHGNFAFGIEAASQVFFAKPTNQLSKAECALLAGLVQYPTGYNPLRMPEAAKGRQLTVLRLMKDAGYLSSTEREQIATEPLTYRTRLFNIEAPHFVMYIQDQVVQRLGKERFRRGGWQIVTTLDLNLQRKAETAVRFRLDQLNCRVGGMCDRLTNPKRRVDNAAAVILDAETGDVLAMVGSPDFFDERIQGNVNGALTLRQPGSAIKPFTYAAALDPNWSGTSGSPSLTPASIIADLPVSYSVANEQGELEPYQPVNYDRIYHGPVSVRSALANSYNVPAVKVLERIGVSALQELASQAGISSFTKKDGLALTLGGSEVRLLDLTTAYGLFQTGHRLQSRSILSIQQGRTAGRAIASEFSSPENGRAGAVISPQAAYLITDILSDNMARVPAFGTNSPLNLPFSAAAKTGTTTDWRDNWTVGYSTKRIVGVWVGNADNAPMVDISGIDGAGPIWRDLMLAAHAKHPPSFVRPAGLENVIVCAPSGLLPTRHCPRLRNELFLRGTAPTALDNQFQSIPIDRATGQRATGTTPRARVAERVYWALPASYHEWMVANGIAVTPLAMSMNSESMPDNEVDQIANASLLHLRSPVSHMAYRLHRGLPRERQRIEISGYVTNGRSWRNLRIVKDGATLTEEQESDTISSWWTLTPGHHIFWIEGEAADGSNIRQSQPAYITVEEMYTYN